MNAGATPREIWTRMRWLVLESEDRRKRVAEATGMSYNRAKTLRHLAAGPIAMGDLAVEVAVDKAYMTLMIDDLEKRGLVVRETHPADRRSKLVSITPAGMELAKVTEEVQDSPPTPLTALGGADRAELARLLDLITPPGG